MSLFCYSHLDSSRITGKSAVQQWLSCGQWNRLKFSQFIGAFVTGQSWGHEDRSALETEAITWTRTTSFTKSSDVCWKRKPQTGIYGNNVKTAFVKKWPILRVIKSTKLWGSLKYRRIDCISRLELTPIACLLFLSKSDTWETDLPSAPSKNT